VPARTLRRALCVTIPGTHDTVRMMQSHFFFAWLGTAAADWALFKAGCCGPLSTSDKEDHPSAGSLAQCESLCVNDWGVKGCKYADYFAATGWCTTLRDSDATRYACYNNFDPGCHDQSKVYVYSTPSPGQQWIPLGSGCCGSLSTDDKQDHPNAGSLAQCESLCFDDWGATGCKYVDYFDATGWCTTLRDSAATASACHDHFVPVCHDQSEVYSYGLPLAFSNATLVV